MSFTADIRAFGEKVAQRQQAVFVESATEMHRSIQEGSSVTGAPGQPVDTGNLRRSWQLTFPEPFVAQSATNVEYAPFIEDGGYTQRSQVGGPHSVKMTRSEFDRIADHAVRIVVGP